MSKENVFKLVEEVTNHLLISRAIVRKELFEVFQNDFRKKYELSSAEFQSAILIAGLSTAKSEVEISVKLLRRIGLCPNDPVFDFHS